jgi:hypothetical protein
VKAFRSLGRRLEKLEQGGGSTPYPPWEVPPAISRACSRLREESPRAIWLVENLILKRERKLGGVAIPHTGVDNLEPTDEELVAFGRLADLEREEEEAIAEEGGGG